MVDVEELQERVQTLSATLLRGADIDDAGRIELIRDLEELKCVAEYAQADVAADLDTSVRAAAAERGVPAERQGRGVAAQVGLARRESHHRGTQHLALAKTLHELPYASAAWRAGKVSQWRVTLIAKETACLELEDRLFVDKTIASDPDTLEAMGDRELGDTCRALANELDPAAAARRRAKAEQDRHVSIRPAPDVMARLSALLPVKDGVAVYAALKQTADTLIAAGDERSRGQIMADTLVDRVTGRVPLNGTEPTPAPQVNLHIVIDDDILFGDSHHDGHLDDWGPIPADLARDLACQIKTMFRRLYASPKTGELIAMDSRLRLFPEVLAMFIRLRDRFCRTPWCDAPIRHVDHSWDHADGGPTDAMHGQGLCEACSYAKQAHGWRARPGPGDRHTITTTTPTGHSYRSTAPPTRQRHPVEQHGFEPTVVRIYRTLPDLIDDYAA